MNDFLFSVQGVKSGRLKRVIHHLDAKLAFMLYERFPNYTVSSETQMVALEDGTILNLP